MTHQQGGTIAPLLPPLPQHHLVMMPDVHGLMTQHALDTLTENESGEKLGQQLPQPAVTAQQPADLAATQNLMMSVMTVLKPVEQICLTLALKADYQNLI